MSYWTRTLMALALATLAAPRGIGSSDPVASYPSVLPAHQGQEIVVKLQKGLGKPVKGVFQSLNSDGIRLECKNGKRITVPWESVLKISPKRKWYEFWVGVATGAALAGVAVLSSEGDVGAGWSACVIGAGAAAGAATAVLWGPTVPPRNFEWTK